MTIHASKTKLYWTDPDSKNNETITVIFDAVTSLTPDDPVTITDHPVEEGADVTDNARSQANRLSIEAIVSMGPNQMIDPDIHLGQIDLSVPTRSPRQTTKLTLDIPTPPVQFSESGLVQAGIGALTSAILGPPKATVLNTPGAQTDKVTAVVLVQNARRNRVRDVYDTLLKVKDQHALITVLTSHRDYFDMMIERLGKPQTVADGTSAKFQIDLKRIRTVSSSTVVAPKPAEPRAQPVAKKGAQTPKPDPSPQPKVSLAQQFDDALNRALAPPPG